MTLLYRFVTLNALFASVRVMRPLGVHTSIAGDVKNAILRAEELGCDCFQMFSRNPRGWKCSPLSPLEAHGFFEERRRTGLSPVVIHDCYLVNLASCDDIIWEKSLGAFRDELVRADRLKADFLVFHPGNPRTLGRLKGIERTVHGLVKASQGLNLDQLTILVENTAGMGSSLGADFAEVRDLIVGGVEQGLKMACCLDTQHTFAAGYDISNHRGFEKTLTYIEKTVGMDRIKVVHTNDSKVPLGSRVDRHEHIGRGYIGIPAFRRLLTHPALSQAAFILETPIDRPGDDRRNLNRLRKILNS